jgi:glycosyl transferase family 25
MNFIPPPNILVGLLVLVFLVLVYYVAGGQRLPSQKQDYPDRSIADRIDKIVYINLEKRKDRRAHMESSFLTALPPDKVMRFNAIQNKKGAVGCCMSHLAVLEMAEREGWRNVLILEDDCVWANAEEGQLALRRLMAQPYDVIMLGTTHLEYDERSYRIKRALSTSSYLVDRSYYRRLIETIQAYNREDVYAVDYIYTYVQPKDRWFAVVPNLIVQRDDYSDIKGKEVSYQHRFAT